MAAKFSFKVLPRYEEFTRSFESTDGEKYVLRVTYENCFPGGLEMSVNLKGIETSSSKLIQISKILSEQDNHVPIPLFNRIIDNFFQTAYIEVDLHNIIIIDITPIIDQMDLKQSAIQESVPKKVEPVVEKKLEQLEIDMRNLLDSGDLSDVILTDGSKEIPAHKLILCTRSPVFAKMFQHPTKENQENRITIEDISMDVLRQLLHFMYTGAVTIVDMNMAQGLYMAADKYDVKDLKNICSTKLKSVDLDSVLDILLMADLCSDKGLKEASLSFISKKYSQVKSLQRWDSFMKDHHYLAIEILSFVIDKKM